MTLSKPEEDKPNRVAIRQQVWHASHGPLRVERISGDPRDHSLKMIPIMKHHIADDIFTLVSIPDGVCGCRWLSLAGKPKRSFRVSYRKFRFLLWTDDCPVPQHARSPTRCRLQASGGRVV